ncbi:MAG: hypothetical protein EB127_12535 [Alphaproteobacteria bacterium]|nr:hypothetical protein [Alphaproteobacteria bacterium]
MEELLKDLKEWCKTYKEGIPSDAVFVGNKNYQKGIYNSHYGHVHSEETKKIIGSKSVNRNWHKPENYAGSGNPNSKAVVVEIDGVTEKFSCLKDFHTRYSHIPYSTLKWMAQNEKPSIKWKNIKVRYEV